VEIFLKKIKKNVIPEKLVLAKVGSGNNKERELSFWNTFALLSINSAKNLTKTLNYLSGRSFGHFVQPAG